jgi:hypothetical protein
MSIRSLVPGVRIRFSRASSAWQICISLCMNARRSVDTVAHGLLAMNYLYACPESSVYDQEIDIDTDSKQT